MTISQKYPRLCDTDRARGNGIDCGGGFGHRLSNFAFHVQSIVEMKDNSELELSFWNVPALCVKRGYSGQYTVKSETEKEVRCVGNDHGAVQAYVDHVKKEGFR